MVDLKNQLKPSGTQGIKSGVSAFLSADPKDIPQPPKKRYFHSSNPSMRIRYSVRSEKNVAFRNHFLITDDAEVIEYLEKNFLSVNRPSLNTKVQEVDEAFYISATSLPVVQPVIEPLPGQEPAKEPDNPNKEPEQKAE